MSKVIPVEFGATEETTQATAFVLELEGIASAAAVQVAVLALLASRHVEKSGRKPVLFEAARLLTEEVSVARLVEVRLLTTARADVTRTTKAYVKAATQILMLESLGALRAAVDNAATVLLREHFKRSSGLDDAEDAEFAAAIAGAVT